MKVMVIVKATKESEAGVMPDEKTITEMGKFKEKLVQSGVMLAWSKLKALLRDFGARTRDALDDAIRRAMDLIDGGDASAWFEHCGYSGQLK